MEEIWKKNPDWSRCFGRYVIIRIAIRLRAAIFPIHVSLPSTVVICVFVVRLSAHEVVWLFRISFVILMYKDSFILLLIGVIAWSKIKESLYIKTMKPILNNQTTSCSLNFHYELSRSHEYQYKSIYTRHLHLNLSSPPTTRTGNA